MAAGQLLVQEAQLGATVVLQADEFVSAVSQNTPREWLHRPRAAD